ncbi:anti-anti-sigma factor [Amycolatopsis bartoniae]|uniref:STAS domain-containing protein n=1 Tax=Amycolatopsis bartoniae TaxID=941986 RepID=UPI001605BC95|nr:STAS domain-containing protein [Amycolatopsis bartoniae]MBB2937175.1 anti-anti-sigma factor [Amycolatopsis bartoniae]
MAGESARVAAPGPRLRVRVEWPLPAVVVVRVEGEVDLLTGPQLWSALREQAASRPEVLVLDLADVWFFGARGLELLLSAQALLAHGDGVLRLASPSHAVMRTLGVLGMAAGFETCVRALAPVVER